MRSHSSTPIIRRRCSPSSPRRPPPPDSQDVLLACSRPRALWILAVLGPRPSHGRRSTQLLHAARTRRETHAAGSTTSRPPPVDAVAARRQDAKGDSRSKAVQPHARRRIDPATTSSSMPQPRLSSVPYDVLAMWVAGAQVRASHSLFPEAGDLHTTPFTTSSTYPFRYRTRSIYRSCSSGGDIEGYSLQILMFRSLFLFKCIASDTNV